MSFNILIYIYIYVYFPISDSKDPIKKIKSSKQYKQKNSDLIRESAEPAKGFNQITAPATRQHYHQGGASRSAGAQNALAQP